MVFSIWLELIYWICSMFIFHQHILLIACEPSLNLITNYLICVAGKQWEALRFTIEVCTCMVLCLIAHYCEIAGTILIFRFLTIWSCTCRSCATSWACVGFSLEEERVMQQSSVSISHSFENQGINPVGDNATSHRIPAQTNTNLQPTWQRGCQSLHGYSQSEIW